MPPDAGAGRSGAARRRPKREAGQDRRPAEEAEYRQDRPEDQNHRPEKHHGRKPDWGLAPGFWTPETLGS